MNPEVELIIKARNEAKRALKELEKQLRGLERQFNRNENSAKRFSRQTYRLAPILIEVNRASSIMSRGLLNIGRNLVGAAANFETYINTVRVFSTSQEQANARVARLLEVSKELVGLDTGNIISFFGRLTQLNLTDEQAIQAITAVTEGIAEQGKSAATARQVLEQFAQALGNTSILAQDWRTIFRELPQVAKAIAEEFGISARSASEFREGLKSLGLTWQDVRPRFITALDAKTIGANLNTIRSQVDILEDQAEVTAAAFGEIITPSLIRFLNHLNRFLEFLQDLNPEIKAVVVQLGVASTAIAGLTAVTTAGILAFNAWHAALSVAGITSAALASKVGIAVAAIAAGITVFTSLKEIVQRVNRQLEMNRKTVDELSKSHADAEKPALKYADALSRIEASAGNLNNLSQTLRFVRQAKRDFADLAASSPQDALRFGTENIKVLQSELDRLNQKEAEGIKLSVRELRWRLELKSAISQQSIALSRLNLNLAESKKAQDANSESTDKAVKSTRNLTLELVNADTTLRRIRREITSSDDAGLNIIERQTQREVAAITNLANLEVEQAEKSIENAQEKAARIQEIRDKQEDDIADAVKRGAERAAAFEKAGFDQRLALAARFYAARKAQDDRAAARRRQAFADELAEIGSDIVNQAIFKALNLQSAEEAARIELSRAMKGETTNPIAEFMRPYISGYVRAIEAERSGVNQRGLDAARAIREMHEMERQREMDADEARTAFERQQLAERLSQYREYYNLVRRLNFNSVESFIQSTLRATTEYLQQLAIRKTAEIAFSQIGTAAGLAGGALTGGAGFAIAGGIAIGAGILSSLIGNSQRDNARIFHSAYNDRQLEMGVSRGLSQRSPHDVQMNNRTQAQDIAQAVERGVANVISTDDHPMRPIQVNLILNDKVVQQVTIRQDELRQTRRI